jgi:peptide chain release factor 1
MEIAELIRYEDELHRLEATLAQPAVAGNAAQLRDLTRQHARLQQIVTAIAALRALRRRMEDAAQLLSAGTSDTELRQMAEDELAETAAAHAQAEAALQRLLIPRAKEDEANTIVEIRAGTGGEEASLFAGDLFRMYTRYAERKGWRIETLSTSLTELNGIKEVVFSVDGTDVYYHLKYEAGVHRVQRVPATEASGRIHTSAASVAVLPEADEVDIEIKPEDLRIDVFRAGGCGGQHVNTTDSAVRITHLPSGVVVSCQDERSQHKNKAKAMRVLRARVLEGMRAQADSARAEQRRTMVGSGDRSEKIRTYNFPQNRVTDHRIGLTIHALDDVLKGDLDRIIQPLIEHDTSARLKQLFAHAA